MLLTAFSFLVRRATFIMPRSLLLEEIHVGEIRRFR